MKTTQLALIAMVLPFAASAYAADSGAYLGASLGQSKVSDFSGADIDRELKSQGLTTTTTSDDSDTGWKVFGGYQFTKHFAVEAGYTDFGKFTAHTIVTAPTSGVANTDVTVDAWTLSAVGILPLNERFSLFGKIGVNAWSVDAKATVTGSGTQATAREKADGTDWVFGAGANYAISKNLNIRAEWERYDLDGSDADLLSVGVAYKF